MTVLFLLFSGLLLLMFQTALLTLLPPWIGVPDVVFLLVVHAAFSTSLLQAGIAVFLLGVIVDATIGTVSGLYPLLYIETFVLIKFFFADMRESEVTSKAGIACAFYMVACVSYYLFFTLVVPEMNMSPWSWERTMRQVVLLLFIAPGLLRLLEKASKHLDETFGSQSFFQHSQGNRFRR